MSTLFQWIHVSAAVVGVGGMGFLLLVLMPSARILTPEERDLLMQMVGGKFRWMSWTVMILLVGSGLYNMSLVWEAPWGSYWQMLTVKIALAVVVFLISLGLTLPFKFLEPFRARRKQWLTAAFAVALVVILISAYLRRG
ncbi:MAG TPA: hypothetical protein VG204_04530 [Terriglobia bacterium]|nr:hypothetical protein [Terriglobia bacterium]